MKHITNSTVAAGLAVAALLSTMPLAAQAQQAAYTAKDAHLRAGPAQDYPVVAIIRSGTPITVDGCLSDYTWCDVEIGGNRGWVYAGNITYPYQGSNVPILGYGAAIGLGILAFDFPSYWDTYYRGRPWYAQRQQWANHPRPIMRHGPPPQFHGGGHFGSPGFHRPGEAPRPQFRPQFQQRPQQLQQQQPQQRPAQMQRPAQAPQQLQRAQPPREIHNGHGAPGGGGQHREGLHRP